MTLGELIKSRRKQARVNQTVVAKHVGVSQGTISKIENGELEPTLRIAFTLCRCLDISMYEIFNALLETKRK